MAGYGISQADMEASRLVFVSVKNAKPRRKVAVPVPDGASWEAFCTQVQAKLKLLGIDSIYLASSGERVLRTDDLQDIDELYVIESRASPVVDAAAVAQGGNGSIAPGAFARTQSGNAATASQPGGDTSAAQHYRTPDQRHRVGVADTEITPLAIDGTDDRDADAKYIKRNTGLQRSLKRVFPSFFQPSLPVTTRDVKDGPGAASGRRRRRKGRWTDPRTLLIAFALVSCLGTMLYLYSRMVPKLP